jgi:NAD(P)-dependent dehydrogenase (short-subunit alcohol dehydrogenase family)
MDVLIIGASRGIGLEVVRQYRAAGEADMRRVIAGLKRHDNGRFFDHDGSELAS